MKINGNTLMLLVYDKIESVVGSYFDAFEIARSIVDSEPIQELLREHQQRERQNLAYRTMSASETRKEWW